MKFNYEMNIFMRSVFTLSGAAERETAIAAAQAEHLHVAREIVSEQI